jgi:hypothetical protein
MPIDAETSVIRPVWSILMKGRTGTGKSLLAGGKEFRPTYFFDLEGRIESVINYYRRLDGHVKGISFDSFHMNSGFYPLAKRFEELTARPQYKTVVVGSLTSYIHIILNHLIAAKGGNDSGGRAKGKKVGGIAVNVLEDFSAEDSAIINTLMAFLQELKNQGVNIILEAHISPYEVTTITEDKQREVQTIFQILTKGKKAPAQIPSYFNEVWLFEKEFEAGIGSTGKPKYKVNTVGSSSDECKTSFGIESFDWTGRDASEILMGQLSGELRDTPRIDPNAPKKISF